MTPPPSEPFDRELPDEARQALADIALAIDRLTFTRAFTGQHSGHHVLKALRDHARAVAFDLPDQPLRNRAVLKAKVRELCESILTHLSGTVRERDW
jgi:phytoene/squalene synthetase